MESETLGPSLRPLLHPDIIYPADFTDAHPDPLQQGYPYDLNASAFDNIPALSIPDLNNSNATHSIDLSKTPTFIPCIIQNLCDPNVHNLHESLTSQIFSSSSSTHDHYLGRGISDHQDSQPSLINNPSHRSNIRRLVERAPDTDQSGLFTQFYTSAQCVAPETGNCQTFSASSIHTLSHSCTARHSTSGTTTYANLECSGMSNMQHFAPQLSQSKDFKSPDFFAPPLSHIEDLSLPDTLDPNGLGSADIFNMDDVDMHMEDYMSSIFGGNTLDASVLRPEEQITEQPVRYAGLMEAPRRRKRGRPRKESTVLRPAQEPGQKKRRSKATNGNGVSKYHRRKPQKTNAKDGQNIDPSHRACEDNDVEVQDVMTMYTNINDKHGPYADENRDVPDAVELDAKQCSTCPSARDASSEETPQRQKTSRATNPNRARKPQSKDPRRTNPMFRFFCIDPDCKLSREKCSRGMPNDSEIKRHWQTHLEKRYCCTLPHPKGDQWFCRQNNLKT